MKIDIFVIEIFNEKTLSNYKDGQLKAENEFFLCR